MRELEIEQIVREQESKGILRGKILTRKEGACLSFDGKQKDNLWISEKYECLLNLPMTESSPYFYKGHYPSWASVARLIRVPESKLAKKKLNQNEERFGHLLEKEDWPAILDVLGLLVCGIVLFPHIEDYVEMVEVDALLARLDWGENSTIAILVNTYCILNYYYGKKGRVWKSIQ
ncbi:hypothetical protein CR513_29640, partial [Mucuna pruriens]